MFITGNDDNNNDNNNNEEDNNIPTGPFRFHQNNAKSNNGRGSMGGGPLIQRSSSGNSTSSYDDNNVDNDGRWSPPPPLNRDSNNNNNNKQSSSSSSSKRASSVGVAQSRSNNNSNNNDIPPWEKRAPSNNRSTGTSNSSSSSSNNKKGVPTKSILPSSGGSTNAVVNNNNSNNPNNKNKIVLKAPLPPQAKRIGNNSSSSNKNNGKVVSGGARPPASSDNSNDTGEEGDEEQGEPERVKYSDLHRNTPDFELIDRLEREILDLAPNIRWSDIAGLDDAKGVLQEAVVLPIMCPGFFSGIRKPWKGVLLYGPPGTGKTLLAKAVATECRTTFINVSASSLASKWRGDGEKMVRILFNMAKHYAPAVVFFDEVDSIATKRTEGEQEASRRMKTEMLIRMDGIGNSNGDAASDATSNNNTNDDNDNDENNENLAAAKMVMVLGATNQPWELDDAFKRRFEKRIYIPLPGIEERVALFRICLKDIRLADDVNLRTLASLTEHYSGADIAVVCKHAAYAPMRQKQAEVAKAFPRSDQIRDRILAIQASEAEVRNAPLALRDFEEAIVSNKPSASNANLKQFEVYAAEHGAT